MEYEVVDSQEIPVTDLSEIEEVPPDLEVCDLAALMGLEEMKANLWYFEPGDEISYHAHTEQEEFYYVIKGEFSVKVGRSGETEIVEVSEGDFYAAGPEIGHGHRYTGDDEGVILAIGAPPVEDMGVDPHSLDD